MAGSPSVGTLIPEDGGDHVDIGMDIGMDITGVITMGIVMDMLQEDVPDT